MRYLLYILCIFFPMSTQAYFTDVPSSHPNSAAITWAKEEGIIEGYSDGTFKSDARINRAEFTKIMMGIFEAQAMTCYLESSQVLYSDVPLQSWYYPYVCMATHSDIVGGYPDGTFKPSNEINFAEAAKIVVNIVLPTRIPVPSGLEWYVPFIQVLHTKNAVPSSVVLPEQKITRGEMVEIIYRLKHPTSNTVNVVDEVVPSNMELVDIHEIFEEHNFDISTITSPKIIAFTTHKNQVAWAVQSQVDSTVYIYNNGKLVQRKIYNTAFGESLVSKFQILPTGNLLYSLNGTSLYIDNSLISSKSNTYNYFLGVESTIYKDGWVYYPETTSIRRYNVESTQSEILFDHEATILYLRMYKDDVFYTANLDPTSKNYVLFKNGKQINALGTFIQNPYNFLVSMTGDVYYQVQETNAFYKNNTIVHTTSKQVGFFYNDYNNKIWHIEYDKNSVDLYRDWQLATDLQFGNAEGTMGFNPLHTNDYAIRIAMKQEPNAFFLLKNGNVYGERFLFQPGYTDYSGLQFASDGSVYSRNYVDNQWYLFKDGYRLFLPNVENVVHFSIIADTIRVYTFTSL